MRRTDWKRVSLSGVMQLFGVICIKWIERLMAGISHQHVLSYNPKLQDKGIYVIIVQKC